MEIVLNKDRVINNCNYLMLMNDEIIFDAIILDKNITFAESCRNSIKVKAIYNNLIDNEKEINKLRQECYDKIKNLIKGQNYILSENGQVIEISVKNEEK